jgi:hypothetical protein
MIPRKIHYCWLSGEPLPGNLEKCLSSWRSVLDDYEIVRWDAQRFDINSIPFVKEACSVKKWAFAADYIRLHALYEEGGIYLDADVYVRSRFYSFLSHDFFSAVEYHPSIVKSQKTHTLLNVDGSRKNTTIAVPGIGVQAALMGSIKGHPFLKKAMDYYRDRSFVLDDGPLQLRCLHRQCWPCARKISDLNMLMRGSISTQICCFLSRSSLRAQSIMQPGMRSLSTVVRAAGETLRF